MRDFKKYDIWIDAMVITDKVYKTLEEFPVNEKFSLISQMTRSAISIPSSRSFGIAEGAGRRSEKDFARFLEFSLGSSYELETQLIIAFRRTYISKENQVQIIDELTSLQKRISGLIKKILKK